LLIAPIGLIAAFISDAFAEAPTRMTWLVAGVVAQLGLTAVVLLGRAIGAGRTRIGVLVTIVLAAATRAGLIAAFVPLMGAADPIPPLERLIGATATFGMWMLFIGAALESIIRTRVRLRALLMRVDVTLAEADALQTALSTQVDAAALRSVDDLARTAHELHRAIDERLRPLSHRLWFGVTSPHLWRRTLLRVLGQPVPVIPASALLAWFLFWNSSFRFDVPIAVTTTVVSIGTLAIALHIGQSWVQRSTVNPAVGYPVTVMCSLALSALALFTLGLSQQSPTNGDYSGWIGVNAASLLVIVMSMIITSDSRMRAESLRDLTEAVDDLQPRRRAAASFLHNAVNSTWRALAMQLDLACQRGDLDQARGVLEQMRVESTRQRFEDHERTSMDRLSAAPARWHGLAHISIDVDGEVPDSLRSPISELVDEAITNSVRHGRARHVEAFISVTTDFVEVVVVDDGTTTRGASSDSGSDSGWASGGESGGGLGSAWLDTHAEWSREHGPAGTRLTVRWPCLP